LGSRSEHRFGARTRGAIAAMLVLAAFAASAAPTPAQAATFEITGTRFVSQKRIRAAAGMPPPLKALHEPWARRAVRRIVSEYRSLGYTWARAWWRSGSDGKMRIHIDEGRMDRVVFIGPSVWRAVLLRAGLNLPGQVYHAPTVQKELRSIRRRYGFARVYHRVAEDSEARPTPLGTLAPVRIMRVYAVSRESFGWGFDIDTNPNWGLLPAVAYRHGGLLVGDDRFRAQLEIAVPYRRYLFEAEPETHWVHGGAKVSYRTVALTRARLAPLIEAAGAVSRYQREDLGLDRYYTARVESVLSLAVLAGTDYSLAIGGGYQAIDLFAQRRIGEEEGPPDVAVGRYLAQARLELQPGPRSMRRDLRNRVVLLVRVAEGGDSRRITDTELKFLFAWAVGVHDLLLRGRGVWLRGDVTFFDEKPLAGETQRAYFASRFWVRRAGQLETAARFGLGTSEIQLGLFHDISVFENVSNGGEAALANAFGPSLHLILFDLLAVDVYSAFGFSPAGFGHDIGLSVHSAY
jgi:hypothetical protein